MYLKVLIMALQLLHKSKIEFLSSTSFVITLKQAAKAPSPMNVTLVEMEIVVRLNQLLNTPPPMDVKPFGKVVEISFEH